jgi:UDP-N-acetylglucosamine transferase subunit ALG13
MIVVTVGTTMPFPSLLAEVDRLSALGIFGEKVICQTGLTDYSLKHCESFKFRPTLDDLFAEASLVITHGGSTVFSLLSSQKPFIAFPNPIGADDHQRHVLRTLSEQVNILWSENVSDLERLYHLARTREPAVFDAPKLGNALLRLINGSE